jgi:hypothetical protein
MRVLLFTLPPRKKDSPQRHKVNKGHKEEKRKGKKKHRV